VTSKGCAHLFCFITPLVRGVSANLAEKLSPNGTLGIQAYLLAVVQVGMAGSAKGDQIFFAIVARSAAKFLVVNFKVGHRSA